MRKPEKSEIEGSLIDAKESKLTPFAYLFSLGYKVLSSFNGNLGAIFTTDFPCGLLRNDEKREIFAIGTHCLDQQCFPRKQRNYS